MTNVHSKSIRSELLEIIREQTPRDQFSASLQQGTVLDSAARRLQGISHEAILTQWGELFRTGILAWGMNLSNPNPPFFHLTERGRQALAHITRDPSNPDGYLRHLQAQGNLDAVTLIYAVEAVECYVNGLFKASAVMIGCASESLVLVIRDHLAELLEYRGQAVPKKLTDWKAKTVTDAIRAVLEALDPPIDRSLREEIDAYWSTFAFHLRMVRNEAGHPVDIDPISEEQAHSALLIFPEMVKYSLRLIAWLNANCGR